MLARVLVRAVAGCGLLFSLASILALWAFAQYPYVGKLALACAVCAVAAPRATVLALLLLLPVFGNKPATPQLHYLIIVQSAIMLGIAARLLCRRGETNREPPHAAVTLGLLYVLVSALSLSGLDLAAASAAISSHLMTSQPRVWLLGINRFLAQDECSSAYPYLSVLLTVHAATLGLQLVTLGQEKRRGVFALQIGAAILGGLLLSVFVGLLDYYGVLSLSSLRALDPTANPGGVQFRLQSFFGHSGWFAEYLTLTVPFVLVLLALPIRYGARVAIVLFVLLVGEWALILTFQRGGWVSYPITLAAVWGSIYVGRKLERGEHDVVKALRSSFLKVAISLPLTVAVSFLLIFGLSRLGVSSPTAAAGLNSYIERFQDIQKASDRTDFMRAGWLIGTHHPFLGAGSESFCRAFEADFVSPQGRFTGLLNLPLHGSAHNVYFQTFAGKGFGGLLLLLLILFQLLVPTVRAVVSEPEQSFAQRLVLLCGFCFAAAFLVYGMVQEIFYVQSLQILFFAVLSAVALVPTERSALAPRRLRQLSLLVCALFLGHIFWEYALSDASVPPTPYGCSDDERDNDDQPFRWCSTAAGQALPVEWEDGLRVIKVPVRVESQQIAPFGMVFEVRSGSDELAKVVVLKVGTLELLTLPLPERLLDRIYTDGLGRERLFVTLRSDVWFIPQLGNSSVVDPRLLSYRLYLRE